MYSDVFLIEPSWCSCCFMPVKVLNQPSHHQAFQTWMRWSFQCWLILLQITLPSQTYMSLLLLKRHSRYWCFKEPLLTIHYNKSWLGWYSRMFHVWNIYQNSPCSEAQIFHTWSNFVLVETTWHWFFWWFLIEHHPKWSRHFGQMALLRNPWKTRVRKPSRIFFVGKFDGLVWCVETETRKQSLRS